MNAILRIFLVSVLMMMAYSDNWWDPCMPGSMYYTGPCKPTTTKPYKYKEFGIVTSTHRYAGTSGTVFVRWHNKDHHSSYYKKNYVKQCSQKGISKNENFDCRYGNVYSESDVHLYENAVEVTLFSTDKIKVQKVYLQTYYERFEATKFYYKTDSGSKKYLTTPWIGLHKTNPLYRPRVYFDFTTFSANNNEIEMKIYDTPPQIFFKMTSRWDNNQPNYVPPTHVQLHLYYFSKQYQCQFKARDHGAGTSSVSNPWHSCIWYLVEVDDVESLSLFQVKISSNSLDDTYYTYIKILEQDGTESFNKPIHVNDDWYLHLEIQQSEWTVKFKSYTGYSAALDSYWNSRGDLGRNVIVSGDDNYDPNGDCLTRGFVQNRVDMQRTDDSDTWNTVWTGLDTVVYMGLSAPALFPSTAAGAGAAGLFYAGFSSLIKGSIGNAFSKDETILFEAIDEAFRKMEVCLKKYTDFKTNQLKTQILSGSLANEAGNYEHAWTVKIGQTLDTLSDVSVDGDGGQIKQMYNLLDDNMEDLTALYSTASCTASCSAYSIQKSKLFAKDVWGNLDARKLIYDQWLHLIKSNPNARSLTDNMAKDANGDFKHQNAYYIKSYLSYISTLNSKYGDNMYYLRNLWSVAHVCDRIAGTYLYTDGRTSTPLSFKFIKDVLGIDLNENKFLKDCPKKVLDLVKEDTYTGYNKAVTSSSGFKSSLTFGGKTGHCSDGFVYFGIRYFTNSIWGSGNIGMVYYCRPKYVSPVNYFQYEVRAVSSVSCGVARYGVNYYWLTWEIDDVRLKSWSAGPCPPGSAIGFSGNSPNGCRQLPSQSVSSLPSDPVDAPYYPILSLPFDLFYVLLPVLVVINVVCVLMYCRNNNAIKYKTISVTDTDQSDTEI